MLGDLYDKFQFEENLILDIGERGNTSFWPAKNFVSADMVNRSADTLRHSDGNSDIVGFIWLDLDELANQVEGTGFSYYFFSQYWKKDNLFKSQRQKYENLMQSQPLQKVTLQIDQSSSTSREKETGISQQEGAQKKPETARFQVPQQPRVATANYPTETKDEHKFFYDAYYGRKESLLRNIEIAKRAGTLNWQKLWSGMQQTALTNALNNSVSSEIIEILLETGVDPNLKNGIDKSPLRIALERKLPRETIAMLLQYGADPKEIVKIANYRGEVQEQPLIDLEERLEIKNLLEDYSKNPVEFKRQEQPAVIRAEPNDLMNSLQQLSNSLNALKQML